MTATTVKLLFDVHVSDSKIAEPLRALGFDIESASGNPPLSTATDDALLEYANLSGRVLVTFNVRDFLPITADWAERQRSHSGVIAISGVRQNEFGVVIDLMCQAVEQRPDAATWRNLTVTLSRTRLS